MRGVRASVENGVEPVEAAALLKRLADGISQHSSRWCPASEPQPMLEACPHRLTPLPVPHPLGAQRRSRLRRRRRHRSRRPLAAARHGSRPGRLPLPRRRAALPAGRLEAAGVLPRRAGLPVLQPAQRGGGGRGGRAGGGGALRPRTEVARDRRRRPRSRSAARCAAQTKGPTEKRCATLRAPSPTPACPPRCSAAS